VCVCVCLAGGGGGRVTGGSASTAIFAFIKFIKTFKTRTRIIRSQQYTLWAKTPTSCTRTYSYIQKAIEDDEPIPEAARSKAWVCGRSLTGIEGTEPAGGMDVWLFKSVARCQVEVSATDRSLVRKGSTECGVSECDREASIMRRPWPTTGSWAMEKIEFYGLNKDLSSQSNKDEVRTRS
jgi:hypothetical protein